MGRALLHVYIPKWRLPKSLFIINSAQIVMDVYLCRIIFKSALVCLHGEVVLHPYLVNVTQVVICIGVFRIERQGFFICSYSILLPAEFVVENTQVVVCVRESRGQC